MNTDELIQECRKQIELTGDLAVIPLILPGRWGKSDKKRLGRYGPMGKIVEEDESTITVLFSAQELLKFAEAVMQPIHKS